VNSARPRLAFVTLYDATDRANWSGIPYYLAQHLQRHWGEVTYIGSLADLPWLRWKQQWSWRWVARGWGKRYLAENDPRLTRHYAQQVSRRLQAAQFDVIFSPSTIPIADLATDVPIVTYCDATFGVLLNFYPEYSNLSDETLRNGHALERRAAQRATLMIYTSEWAANSIRQEYGAPPDRVKVIPFGSNLDQVPSREVALQRQRGDCCRLLWLGRAWYRKGGAVAVQVLEELIKLKVPASLTIVGLIPPVAQLPPQVSVIPYLDKQTPEGRAQFEQLMHDHDLLLLPSQADCTPLAVGETNAYGMPVIASAVGGMRTIIREGLNGYVLPQNVTPAAYAEKIASWWDSPDSGRHMAQTAREMFETVLNWDVAVCAMQRAFEQVTGRG
jgi:glycosyltransferase involved in cell wall biosynthesis